MADHARHAKRHPIEVRLAELGQLALDNLQQILGGEGIGDRGAHDVATLEPTRVEDAGLDAASTAVDGEGEKRGRVHT